MILY
jgi:hypothetical protein